jgi:uncharacterized protein YfaS (alpha-2-macroglobulin family)
MKHFFRSLLLILASIGVVILGYYAYILTTDTLSLPFVGQEKQSGTLLQFVVAKPKFLISWYTNDVIDQNALIASLTLDDRPFDPTVSGEGQITVSGEYVAIAASKMTGSSILKINASKYNASRTTKYRLPRDMILTENKNPKEFSITQEWEPRNFSYSVKLVWYSDLTPQDVKWYSHTDNKKNCYIGDAWDSLSFTNINAREMQSERDWQKQTALFHLDFNPNVSHLCIIAGIGWEFYTVEDRYLESFTATGSAPEILSPEYDMQSRIEFRFSSDIYRDIGELYSKEYMVNRKNQKTLFLKSLDISPNIPLTEDNIALTPDRVSIVAPFQEWKKYVISIKSLSDIYGRTVDSKLEFTPIRTPFLSLGLSGRRTMFRLGEPIGAKMYTLKTPKQEYPLTLCQISLEWYARTERMIAENDKKYTDNLYELLGSKEVNSCIKKDIVVTPWESISPFDVRQFSSWGTLSPGLYILAFQNKDDISWFDRFIVPRVFSVIDTQVTLKVDASGKMQVLTTDINTGEPRSKQEISLLQNIQHTFTEEWNASTSTYDRKYFPLSNPYFSKGISIWSTGTGGILKTKKENLIENDYNTPYGLSFEPYWDYEGLYSSFLATSSGSWHFGYVVSTWNDGITGWNFWLKDSDYSWDTRPEYSAFIHTDRRLYLPWDTVYIHAILRKNNTKLTIPNEESFQFRITDPIWSIIKEWTYKTNEYWSIALDLLIPEDAHLGSYTINLESFEGTGTYAAIANSWSSFQVEVFKNPTFTAEVSLRSPDIEWDILLNLRENTNTDSSSPWYTQVYESTFSLEWIVKARYYNGLNIRNIPFTYRIYRSEHFDDNYWGDCFWWCNWQPSPEFYSEWTGTIDSDGFGFFRIPVSFSSFYSDYMYTAEVTIRDPITGEEIVTPATLLAKIPEKYKSYAQNNPLNFIPDKRIISHGEKITGKALPQYGKWDASLESKYAYEIISRSYTQVLVDDLRLSNITVPTSEDTVVSSGILISSGISLDTKWFKSGEYHFRVFPIMPENVDPPSEMISDVSFYVVWDFTTRSHNLQVIPEKTVYKIGETARVLITLPFTWGYLYLTRERGGVIDSEYVPIEWNTMIREYDIDETSVPNIYIWAVAFNSSIWTWARSYAVWYGEIVTDLADKRANLQIETNKTTYTNKENVDMLLTLTDRNGKPLEGEVTLMVVDESLIRLLGNIDLDIIPKFFQKFPFTMKTSLTAIGMERNRFLSRKWANGWSGDKWWDGAQISSRTLFKNTAYYNASIRTNNSGRAKVSFSLPDNVTDYRIIAIAQTKSSQFGVKEKTIQVRRDYTLEAHVPFIAYPGDTTTITTSAFNATKKITQATIVLTLWSGSNALQESKEVIMNPNENQWASFTFTVRDSWKWSIPYRIDLVEWESVLDSVKKTLEIKSIPLIESTQRQFWVFSTGAKMAFQLSDLWDMSILKSRVTFRISSSLLIGMDSAIQSLLIYPYGCIEQTIASTLPNALALKLSSLLSSSLDAKTAQKNLDDGVKKILRMQQFGGWKYWETDTEINTHVTPYVLRSLFIFKDLGVKIPQTSIDAGVKYVEDMVDYRWDLYANDVDFAAEIFWTLALAKSSHAKLIEKSIDPKKLSRHGYLAYAYGLELQGRYSSDVDKKLKTSMKQKSDAYWYWDTGSDMAIYARLLLDRWDIEWATQVLDERLRDVDLSSYYVSTQEKIQLFYSLYKHTLLTAPNKINTINIALRGESIIADLSLTKDKLSQKVEAPRWKMWDEITINRSWTTPLFYEITEYNVPDDILNTPSRSSWDMGVLREFEKIDETRGIGKDGNYIWVTPMTENTFDKWQLYRVTIRVKIPEKSSTWQHLSVEDFVPGWWRPIQGIFQTESRMNSDSQMDYDYENLWSYVEVRDDRILANIESGYGNTKTYVYYFRPEYSGTYLLPPVTAYFMYRPEVHAIGRYEMIVVK